MKIKEAREYLQKFANKHKIIFDDKTECGFGRPCVSLSDGDKHIDYNPYKTDGSYDWDMEFYNADFSKFSAPNSYHKHDCFAVLVEKDNYDKAIIELAEWVKKLDDKYNIELVDKPTGAHGIQAVISGLSAMTMKLSAKHK